MDRPSVPTTAAKPAMAFVIDRLIDQHSNIITLEARLMQVNERLAGENPLVKYNEDTLVRVDDAPDEAPNGIIAHLNEQISRTDALLVSIADQLDALESVV